jgi:hypothetical protein
MPQYYSKYNKNTLDFGSKGQEEGRATKRGNGEMTENQTKTFARSSLTSKLTSLQSEPSIWRGCKKPTFAHTSAGMIPVKALLSS